MLDTRKSGLIQSSPPSLSRTEMYVSAAGIESKPSVRPRDHSYRDPDALVGLVHHETADYLAALAAPNVAPAKADQSFQFEPIVDHIVNGDFAADTDWTKGTGWTIAAGVASCDGTQLADSDLTQVGATLTTALVAGGSYVVVFTVDNYSAGNVTAVVGDTEGTDRAADGVFTETISAGAGVDIDIRGDVDFVGDVDLVSVTRLASGTVEIGGVLSLLCGAVGGGTLTYQWQKDAGDVVGATGPELVIDPVLVTDGGVYTCDVTNATGTTTSVPVTVTVV